MGKVNEEALVGLHKLVENLELCKVTVIKQKQVEQLPSALPSELKSNTDLEVVGYLPNYQVVFRDTVTGQYKRNSLDVYVTSMMQKAGMSKEAINEAYSDWFQTALVTYRQLFYR